NFFSFIADCGPFERRPVLAVAVSGGADSMALLLIANNWAKAQGGHVTALTIDHGLRKESAEEATQVRQWCDERGIKHVLFPSPLWERVKVTQAAAREVRYRLLTNWCRENHVLHLLTAHHRDDQAETLIFRLGRGSWLHGLACMPAISHLHGIRLLRPLLPVPKSQLTAILMAAGQPWIEDPSNNNPKYTRNRIRAVMAESPFLSEQAAHLAQRFGHIRAASERALAAKIPHIIFIFRDHASMQLKPMLALAETEGLELLAALVMALSRQGTPPRTEKLRRLYYELPRFKKQRSFANLMFIRRKNGEILVRRLENPSGASHITTMRHQAKALAGAPFSVKNSDSRVIEGARAHA
ncbi:MAG: tRNA lysidine(34) synthetase TilS, partial [Pseudomonadota bacterium]|nr:tRNA lysidine(34) synthetase TilS [Pseudomonadota bacterium]